MPPASHYAARPAIGRHTLLNSPPLAWLIVHSRIVRLVRPGEQVPQGVNLPAPERNKEAMDEDGDLLARVGAGDDTALRELVFRHTPWLGTRLRTVLSTADAEDVLQETFLTVWRSAGSYRADGEAGAWLWGIARRQAALLLRRRGPFDLLAVPAEAVVAARAEVAPTADPAQAAVVRAELAEAVSALGPEGSADREVWRLMYEEDRPIAEVARLLGVPPGTVKSRAHRVRRVLRGVLSGERKEDRAR